MESAEAILSQLTTIKWLLVFIGLCMLLIFVAFFVLVVNAIDITRENKRRDSAHSKQSELEDLLATGQSKAAKFTALEWVAAQPRRAEAHWALAKAHYQLGELSLAKDVLKGLLKVSPEEHYRVDAWLDLLDNEFSSNRPKPVD
ncbi:hypothetical protein [Luteimonas sp. R10]|uniref:hypothetical protein n=1 Tax=Luteimonas sp. R10 TaxID=3108176 RepID=UPI0030872E8E|nr:hypothetical protein U3649_02355 [Luteimonas sp. R10]